MSRYNVLLFVLVSGCADPSPLDGAKLTRSQEVATITCLDDSELTWRLRCNTSTGEWIGKYHQCRGSSESGGDDDHPFGELRQSEQKKKLPQGC